MKTKTNVELNNHRNEGVDILSNISQLLFHKT